MSKEEKKTNKFERTRLLSARALEISKGAKPKINTKKHGIDIKLNTDYIKVAQKELEEGKLDLEVLK